MLVTYKAYARKIGKEAYEVRKLIEEGRISGVKHDNRAGYLVHEDALVNYAPRRKSKRSMDDHAFNLMKGLFEMKNVNSEILEMPRIQYESLILSLVNAGLIRRDREERCFESGLALTAEGMRLAGQKKPVFLKLYKATVEAAFEGTTRALIGSPL